MAVETKRSLQEGFIALAGVKCLFHSLVPDSTSEDWVTRKNENRLKDIALCRVQRCFGERLNRDAEDLFPICLSLDTILNS